MVPLTSKVPSYVDVLPTPSLFLYQIKPRSCTEDVLSEEVIHTCELVWTIQFELCLSWFQIEAEWRSAIGVCVGSTGGITQTTAGASSVPSPSTAKPSDGINAESSGHRALSSGQTSSVPVRNDRDKYVIAGEIVCEPSTASSSVTPRSSANDNEGDVGQSEIDKKEPSSPTSTLNGHSHISSQFFSSHFPLEVLLVSLKKAKSDEVFNHEYLRDMIAFRHSEMTVLLEALALRDFYAKKAAQAVDTINRAKPKQV